jgi:acetyl esterase/lipase
MAPNAVYPRQLEQGALALRYLVDKEKRSYEEVILAGDSAGANLALGLLSHVMHPHPSIPAFQTNRSFKGLLLLSPWVTFRQDSLAMSENMHKDILNPMALKEWSIAFLDKSGEDEYNSPLMATPEWWSGMPVEKCLITAGADEVFRDDVVAFAGKMKERTKCGQVELFVGEKECHDMPVIDHLFGVSNGLSMSKILGWVCERVD